jgi:hypothetical protein
MLLDGSYQEPLRCGNVPPVFAEQEIDCQAMLIDGAIEVGPSPSDSEYKSRPLATRCRPVEHFAATAFRTPGRSVETPG